MKDVESLYKNEETPRGEEFLTLTNYKPMLF